MMMIMVIILVVVITIIIIEEEEQKKKKEEEEATSYRKTSTCLHTEGKIIVTEDIETQREIFQAGTLSPLLFCISSVPLTQQMNKLNTRYEEHTTTKVSHFLYMDDWKLTGTKEDELQKQMQAVRTFRENIHMEFGLDKCAKAVLKRGKLDHSQNLILDFNQKIKELKQGKTYKYLGSEESEGKQHQQMEHQEIKNDTEIRVECQE
jgi:hypothetical protein